MCNLSVNQAIFNSEAPKQVSETLCQKEIMSFYQNNLLTSNMGWLMTRQDGLSLMIGSDTDKMCLQQMDKGTESEALEFFCNSRYLFTSDHITFKVLFLPS